MLSYTFSKLARSRPTTVLKIKLFADTLLECRLDFKQSCIPFWNFHNTYFAENLSITAFHLSGLWFSVCVRTAKSACKLAAAVTRF